MAENFIRTPNEYPLNTITREQSPELAQEFLAFLDGISTNAKERAQFIQTPNVAIPELFEGRRVWASYLSPIKDQEHCGGCYAFAACSALSDRYNLRSEGILHLNLSAARIIQCDTDGKVTDIIGIGSEALRDSVINQAAQTLGCHGNTLLEAWRYLNNLGTNTVSCVPENPIGKTCKELVGPFYDTCEALSTPDRQVPCVFYRAMHLYVVPGVSKDGGSEEMIRKNIFLYGPVSTAMDIMENFYTFNPQNEIYCGKGKRISGHAVVFDGWGEENGVKFWWVRNSWGPTWGMNGYFRLLRGSNCCRSEENVIVGVPVLDPIGTLDGPEYMVDLLNLPPVNAIRRSLVSTFASNGGIDPRTNISRRYLSQEAFQNQPETRMQNLPTAPSAYVAGLVGQKGGAGWLWWIIGAIFLISAAIVLYISIFRHK